MTPVLRLREDAVEWRELDGEIVALENRGSVYLTANAPGALLWRRLAHGATRAQLVDALLAVYAVETDVAGRDVDAFVAAVQAHGLLEAAA
jgi:Coenzyme PQQ synthesis protein D (PqqD)